MGVRTCMYVWLLLNPAAVVLKLAGIEQLQGRHGQTKGKICSDTKLIEYNLYRENIQTDLRTRALWCHGQPFSRGPICYMKKEIVETHFLYLTMVQSFGQQKNCGH